MALQITGRVTSIYRSWGRSKGSENAFFLLVLGEAHGFFGRMEDLGVTAPHSASPQCKRELLLCREAAGNYRRALTVGLCWGWRCRLKRGKAKGSRTLGRR